MKRLLLTLLCSGALFAQESISRVLQLKHVNPEFTRGVLDILSAGKVRWIVEPRLQLITMQGPKELVEAMEAAVNKLDVPAAGRKNVELTFHMLLASPQGDVPAIPQELTGVAQQLRNVFGLKAVRVLETAVVRSREGSGGETGGTMSPPSKVDAPAKYYLRYVDIQVSATDKGYSIRLDKLRFGLTIPVANAAGAIQYTEPSISTDVDIREGQKVVVGKTSVDSGSQSIFLVVTAKVMD